MKIKSKVKAISDLLKTELPIAAGVCVLAGEILALGHLPSAIQAFSGFSVGFCLSGAAMISNDYFDLEVDRINHPNRPLPSGRISTTEVAVLTGVFSAAGLAASVLFGLLGVALASVTWAVGFLYNWKYKETGLPGNIMVALSVAMTFIFGGITVGGVSSGVAWTFGALAFVFDLAEEIASGAMDVKGDLQRAAKSVAILKGRPFALRVSASLFGLFVGLTLIPFAAGWLGFLYLVVVGLTDVAVVYLTFKLLKSETPKEGRLRLRQLYLTLTVAVLAIIVTRLL